MAISPQRLKIYLYSAHRSVIFAIAQLSCFTYQIHCYGTDRSATALCRQPDMLFAIFQDKNVFSCYRNVLRRPYRIHDNIDSGVNAVFIEIG